VIKQLKPQVKPQFYQIVKERFKQEAATLQTLGSITRFLGCTLTLTMRKSFTWCRSISTVKP
jgi:hypothetical protein